MKSITRRSMLKIAGGSAIGFASSSAFGSLISSVMEGDGSRNEVLIRLSSSLVRKQLVQMGFSRSDSEFMASRLVIDQVQAALNSSISTRSGKRTKVVMDMGALQRSLGKATVRGFLLDAAGISREGQDLARTKFRALGDGLPRGFIASRPADCGSRSLSGKELREALSVALTERRLRALGFNDREVGELVARMDSTQIFEALENVELQMGAEMEMDYEVFWMLFLCLPAIVMLLMMLYQGRIGDDDEDCETPAECEQKKADFNRENREMGMAVAAAAAVAVFFFVAMWYD